MVCFNTVFDISVCPETLWKDYDTQNVKKQIIKYNSASRWIHYSLVLILHHFASGVVI